MTHAAAQELAAIEFAQKFGHATPASLEEANWLDARVAALKAETGVAKVAVTPSGQVVHVQGPMVTPTRWPLVVAGVAGIGAVGLWLFASRRPNPRRSRWTPVVAVGSAIAGLWWLGRRAAAQVQSVVPAAEPTPLEGAFD